MLLLSIYIQNTNINLAAHNKASKMDAAKSAAPFNLHVQGGIMRKSIFALTLCCFLAPSLSYCDELTLEKKAAIKAMMFAFLSPKLETNIFLVRKKNAITVRANMNAG